MSIPYAQNIDVNQMQLIQPVIDKQASPASGYGIEGQIVYDSTGKKLGYHDGSSWIYLANTDHQTLSNRSAAEAHPGTSISLDASGFNGQLATTDDTVQKLAQKFDDLVVPSLPSGTEGQTLYNNAGTWTANSVLTVQDTDQIVEILNGTGKTAATARIKSYDNNGLAQLQLFGKNTCSIQMSDDTDDAWLLRMLGSDGLLTYEYSSGGGYGVKVKLGKDGKITSDSLTASTLLQSDANKGITSITNGAGYLKNNGSGTFTYDTPSFSLTNWTESNYTYNTKYGVKFTPLSAQTNVDAVIQPKGTGAFQLQEADGASTGGNNRGLKSVDLQLGRTAATQVVSGDLSFAAGSENTVTHDNTIALGDGVLSRRDGELLFSSQSPYIQEIKRILWWEGSLTSGVDTTVELLYGGNGGERITLATNEAVYVDAIFGIRGIESLTGSMFGGFKGNTMVNRYAGGNPYLSGELYQWLQQYYVTITTAGSIVIDNNVLKFRMKVNPQQAGNFRVSVIVKMLSIGGET